jgi:hypothetical protein
MSRFFNLKEAEGLLPKVEHLLRDALFHKAEHDRVNEQLNTELNRIRMAGGVRVNPGPLLEMRTTRDASVSALKQSLGEIQEMGVLVKDLDIGLIDFPAQYQGREVYLCWKLGEDRIEFWHEVDAGFRGRRAIDEKFRFAIGETSTS